MCLNSSRLLKSLWTPGIGIQNHLSGQLPWIRSWRNCNRAGKPSKTFSRDAPCRVHEKGAENNSSRLGDTTRAIMALSATMAALNPTNAAKYRRSTVRCLRLLIKPATTGTAMTSEISADNMIIFFPILISSTALSTRTSNDDADQTANPQLRKT